MELFLIFQESVFPIFLIIGIAIIFDKLFKPDRAQISNLALYAFAPVFVFNTLVGHQVSLSDLQTPFLFMCLLTIVLMGTAYGVAFLMRLKEGDRSSFVLACSMINVGNFGLPLIYFAYGEKAIAYSVIYFVVFNIPLTTVAIFLSSNKGSTRAAVGDIFKIPILYALAAAIVFCFYDIEMPKALGKGLDLFSKGCIPLFIVLLGLQLSNSIYSRGKKYVHVHGVK